MTTHRRGLHGHIVDLLGRRIVSREIPENGTLDLAELAAELDVSRTVLREALKVLAGKGLVDARQKRGTFTQPRANWNLLDEDVIAWEFATGGATQMLRHLAEVREILEPAAARLAAERRSEVHADAIESAVGAMAEAETSAAAVRADLQFHRSVLDATGNELLGRMETIIASVLAERDRLVHGVVEAHDPVPAHRAIYEAIRDGDADAAESQTRALLAKARADLDLAVNPSESGSRGDAR